MKNIVDIGFIHTIINYGTVGKETDLVDCQGNTLFIGDIVEITTTGGVYTSVVVEDDDHAFLMGWKCNRHFLENDILKVILGHGGLTVDHDTLKEWDFTIMSEELMKDKIKEYAELNNVILDIKSEIAKAETLDELKVILSKYSKELM